ncbi:hypothetical protein [Arthrobacter sp. AG258]|uniref:hypothetical protein n=1 Tax=Arthrobacter sp. AG258 TaxID=2183899 RepID=UPI001FB86ED7|nr:hypothetical protein [Arthrobacter sp. AG258]
MLPSAVVNVVQAAAAELTAGAPGAVSAGGEDGTSDGVGGAGAPVAAAEAAAEDREGCGLAGCGEQPASSTITRAAAARNGSNLRTTPPRARR